MAHLKSLGVVLFMAGLMAAMPLRADDRLGDPTGNAITAFEVASGDVAKLGWLQGWSASLPDPFARFAALSFGWSASEQLAVARVRSERPLQRRRRNEPSPGFDSKYGHLAQVHMLAELRLRGDSSGARWQAHHLCNAVRLNREWLLSSAGCVTLQAELAGLEARLDAADLAASDGTIAAVDRIVRQQAGVLVLLHLSGKRGLPDPGPLYWLGSQMPAEARSHLLSWGRPKPIPGLPATLFRHIELDAAYDEACDPSLERCFDPVDAEVCDIAAEPRDYLCLVQAGVRLCPGDDGSPVYFLAEDGTVSLQGMVALREQRCFVSTTRELRPAPVINLNRHRAWIEATIAPDEGAGD